LQGEVADFGGFGDEGLVAQADEGAFGDVDFGAVAGVAGFFEVVGKGAGELEGEVFEAVFGGGFFVGVAGGVGIGLHGEGAGGGVAGFEAREVGGEIERRLALPDGCVFGAVGEGDAGFHHVELVGEDVVHSRLGMCVEVCF